MGDLTQHFSRSEFACKHCGKIVIPPSAMLVALERLRVEHYPAGLVVVSAYRCKVHNAEVGGKPDSRHLHGDAVDVHPVVSVATAHRYGFRGIGAQQSDGLVVHLDWRPTPATWYYDANGHTP